MTFRFAPYNLLRKIVNIVSFILTQFVRNYTGMSM